MKPAQLGPTLLFSSARIHTLRTRKTVWSRPNFIYVPRNASPGRSERRFKVSAPSTTLSLRLSFANTNGLRKPFLEQGLMALMRTYTLVWANRNAHLTTLRTLFWFYTNAPQLMSYYIAMSPLKGLTRPRTYSPTLLLGSLKRKLF